MHEHIARALYYFSVHLLFASMVGTAAWLLTSILRASATTKYWIWVVTAFYFVIPSGALIDKLWATHFTWARPLGAIGGPVWDLTGGTTAVVLGSTWIVITLLMLSALLSRLRREHREELAPFSIRDHAAMPNFLLDDIPVSFGHSSPAVRGLFFPRILLPLGIDQLLTQREFQAVLIHEMAHARRRDNLIRLLYELSLCALWFHPLMWLVGRRIALYRELSCDESVIRHGNGQALVSALAKLAVRQEAELLQATASSHLIHRLACLAGPDQAKHRTANISLITLFAAITTTGIFQTIAHTACCFILKH